MKDPFAMLSMPTIVEVTGAVAVLLYRHPGAVLASYRRMGWSPDLDELAPVLADHRRRLGMSSGDRLPRPGEVAEPEALGRFWSALYEMALDTAPATNAMRVISHEELAGGGADAARRLFANLGLGWSARAEAEWPETPPAVAAAGSSATPLHNFNRAPADVAGEWRKRLQPDEISMIEEVTATVHARLRAAHLVLGDGTSTDRF